MATAIKSEASLVLQPSMHPVVFLACKDGPTAFTNVLANELSSQGLSPIYFSLRQPDIPLGSRVISLIDVESPSAG